jgi:hypothetical protein
MVALRALKYLSEICLYIEPFRTLTGMKVFFLN